MKYTTVHSSNQIKEEAEPIEQLPSLTEVNFHKIKDVILKEGGI